MFVRISTIQAEPGRLDDGIRYLREEVQPGVDRIPGSLGLAAWVDRPSGRVSVIALWADRASMEASASAASGLRQDAAKHLGGDAAVEVFETAVVHRVSAPAPGNWSRSSRFDVAAEDVDRAVRYFEGSVLPDVQQQDGLVTAALA